VTTYIANMEARAVDIGTPPQRVMVMIDTGSYELWVNPLCINSDDPVLCGTYGHYYPQLSNTSSSVAGAFKVNYGTGSAQGLYYSDSIRLSSTEIPSPPSLAIPWRREAPEADSL